MLQMRFVLISLLMYTVEPANDVGTRIAGAYSSSIFSPFSWAYNKLKGEEVEGTHTHTDTHSHTYFNK